MKHLASRSGFGIRLCMRICFLPLMAFLLAACSGSDESSSGSERPAVDTAAMRTELLGLRADNQSLKSQLEKARQENRALTARTAELETRLDERRDSLHSAGGGLPMQVNVVGSTSGVSSGEGNPLYERGLSNFMARKYDDAILAFREFLNSGTPTTLEDNSHYWIGECYFAKKNYRAAIEEFSLVAGIQGTDKADDALMMLGQTYLAMGNNRTARQYFERILNEFPGSPYVGAARAKLGVR